MGNFFQRQCRKKHIPIWRKCNGGGGMSFSFPSLLFHEGRTYGQPEVVPISLPQVATGLRSRLPGSFRRRGFQPDLLMPQEALFAREAHSMQAAMRRALLRRGRSGNAAFSKIESNVAGNLYRMCRKEESADDRNRSKTSETEISDYFLERRQPEYGDQGVKKEVKDETKNRIRVISWILFVIYIGLLIYFLFLSEEYGRTSFDQRMYRYNLTPFQEIKRFWIYRHRVGFWVSFLNLAGNVIGFLPFGFFLPILSRRLRNGVLVTMSGFGLSLLVESIQLIFKVGCFDVDDLILNTLGVLFGYLSFWICNGIRRMSYEKKI